MEHYAGCSTCIHFLRDKLHFRPTTQKGHVIVLGSSGDSLREEDTCRLAYRSFTLYKTCNYMRNNAVSKMDATGIISLMRGFLREGVGECEDGLKLLEQGWRHDFSLT